LFNYRRCPAVAFAQRLVREGRLGRLYHVRAHYLQSWGGPQTPLLWRFQKERAGSGAHGDLNAHLVDLARFLTGEEVTEVHGAVARTFIEERIDPASGKPGQSDVDDCVLFLASFESGAVGSFEASRLAPGHLNRNVIELNGEKGSLRFDFEDMNVLEFFDAEDGPREGGWRRIMCTSAENHPYAAAWWPDAHVLGYEHGFVNMAADILRVLGGAEPEVPLPDFEDAYRTQRVLEAALVSARERVAVKLDDIG
jgi:predicted dehydrogenase